MNPGSTKVSGRRALVRQVGGALGLSVDRIAANVGAVVGDNYLDARQGNCRQPLFHWIHANTLTTAP